jgi:ribonuclease HII
MSSGRFVIGVDEAGRGPLAGPVAVGAVAAWSNSKNEIQNTEFKLLKGIKDSKKLSAKQRVKWLKVIKKNFYCSVASVNNDIIDSIGIAKAVERATARAVNSLVKNKLKNRNHGIILLDGLLKAPKRYNQKTIIKGDEKIPLISAASVVAKVYRDRRMAGWHKIFPEYGFDIHKGYGTKDHYKAIRKNGVCAIHRRSYLKKIKMNHES